jgi:glycosyltransferase involved in cell wall biosynthesis
LGFEQALRDSSDATPVPGSEGAFVCLGSVTGYRNLEVLLHAYAAYRQDGGACGLVIAGPPSNARLAERISIRCRDIQGASTHWTRLARDTVLATLAGSRGVVLPSAVEASPLSLLEAVAITPRVIASDIIAHREILTAHGCQGTAGFFDPIVVPSLVRAFQELESEPCMADAHERLRRGSVRIRAREIWAASVDGWLADLRP